MKKRFLIALFVAIMACFFSLVASAANEVTLTNGTTADLTTVFKVTNNEIRGFNDGYSKNDVTDVIFPDDIVGLEANFLFGEATNLNSITFEATDTFFISGDNIFTKCSVKKITFNPDCVVEIRKGNFSGCTSLTEITFPKFKKLAGSSFKDCSNMVATNELILAEGMTDIGGHAFNGCTSLKGTVYFPSTLEKIQEYSFQNTGFEHFDLSKCANLTAVGGGYGGPFTDNDSITTLDLSACVNLKDLHGNFASGCDELINVILPPSLENIPSKAFAHCSKLQSIVLPATVKTIVDEAFHSARNKQTIKTFTVYVQSNVQFGTKYYPFRDSNAKIEFVLIGDGVTVESFKAANTYSAITGATVVDYLDPDSPWTYTTGEAITSHTIVENYCSSLALTGEHLYGDNPCVNHCDNCGLTTVKENPKHTESVSITYAKGYDNVGSKLIICTNEGCGYTATKEAEALFLCQGYSVPENGKGGIVIGYSINHDAISEYEKATGKTLKYGAFAVLKDRLGDNDIFSKDGTVADGVINAEIAKGTYVSFELKITGFTDKYKDIKLAMGAYVAVTDKEGTDYFYLQPGTPNQGEKYSFVSYNEVLAGKTTEEDTLQ